MKNAERRAKNEELGPLDWPNSQIAKGHRAMVGLEHQRSLGHFRAAPTVAGAIVRLLLSQFSGVGAGSRGLAVLLRISKRESL